jgi:hypothetical protein
MESHLGLALGIHPPRRSAWAALLAIQGWLLWGSLLNPPAAYSRTAVLFPDRKQPG